MMFSSKYSRNSFFFVCGKHLDMCSMFESVSLLDACPGKQFGFFVLMHVLECRGKEIAHSVSRGPAWRFRKTSPSNRTRDVSSPCAWNSTPGGVSFQWWRRQNPLQNPQQQDTQTPWYHFMHKARENHFHWCSCTKSPEKVFMDFGGHEVLFQKKMRCLLGCHLTYRWDRGCPPEFANILYIPPHREHPEFCRKTSQSSQESVPSKKRHPLVVAFLEDNKGVGVSLM